MYPPRDQSVGEILDQLLSDELIDACHITAAHVTIVQGSTRHTFPYQQARTFLMGMLRGRSWNLNPRHEGEELGASPRRALEKARKTSFAGKERGSGSKSPSMPGSIEAPLDELLDMSREMELIEGYEKDRESNFVTIILSACQAKMSFEEAITFLAECVLYKLNVIREEVATVPEISRPSERRPKEKLEPRPVWQKLG